MIYLYYSGIAILSSATILLELALLRLFAVQQFYHFAFMAISLALLGAGASGSLLSVRGRRFSPGPLCLAFGLTAMLAYLLINYLPFDSFSIAWDRRQLVYLALYFLAAAVPFFFAGLLVGGELMRQEDSRSAQPPGSHRVYGANLIGSAAGALASLPILAAFSGEGAVVFAALLGAVAGLLFGLLNMRRGQSQATSRTVTAMAFIFILAGSVILVWPPDFMQQRMSPYKTLPVLLQTLDTKHLLTAWDAAARVDVVDSPTIHVMPGLSLLSPVGPPEQLGLTLDGDNLMPISGLLPDAEEAQDLAQAMPLGLVFELRPRARALILEAGTGLDVLLALASGAAEVVAVEAQRLIIEVVRDRFKAFTDGLYSDPRVTIVNQSGRVYARQANDAAFDVAIVALTDPHRPVTSGAYSLTEDYIYTVEAFADYLRTLNDDGLLVITRWLQTPPSESARTFGTLADALRALGAEPADHLAAFRTLRTMTIVASRRPFSDTELETIRTFLNQRNFDPVYYRGVRPEELNRFSVLQEPSYHDLFVAILADPAAVYANYRFDIRPPTDDRPFFFHYFKWRQAPEILATFGLTWQPFGGSGFFVLVALLLLVGLASAVLIISPLLVMRRAGLPGQGALGQPVSQPGVPVPLWRWRVFVYFACLGLAFLFVEVPLAQHFILILDQPVTALAIVLFAILLFSGLGSLTVRRWSLAWGLGLLVILIILYPLLLKLLTGLALDQPATWRVLLTVLALAPLGYLMGLPFAGGLRIVEAAEPGLVPWAWAINGSFSVVSSVLAVMVALSWGFSTVLWLGAAAYTLALFSFGRLRVGQGA